MRYGILSDIHGNLEALQAVLDLYHKEGIKDYLCVGDIVGYGADPRECLRIVRGLNMVTVAGNHDWAVSGRFDPVYFNPVAKEAVLWTRDQLSSDEKDFLNGLPLVHKEDDLILVHGTLGEPEHFHYMRYLSQAAETFDLMDKTLCFIGHSHAPQIIIHRGEENRPSKTLRITIEPGCKYIINAGSVGQPRDGDPEAAYCVYDTELRTVEVKRTTYDIRTAQDKILAAGLPTFLAERLAIGH